jgi:pyruvate/2-oxoglutarate/acetoin dehydrogenase E1 component
VPEELYTVSPGKARVAAQGEDVTIVGISHMLTECLQARSYLKSVGVSAEVIDPIWLKPLDAETILLSARKTGRLCVVDNGWTTCGASAEIISMVAESESRPRDLRFCRLGFAPVTCPPTPTLEKLFYPNARTIASAAYDLVEGRANGWVPDELPVQGDSEFKGPF